MNIILIVIDTLRYDQIGPVQTPNIQRLSEESYQFHNAFAASYPTIPQRTDIMTGRYGGPFHAWHPLPHAAPTLPRYLAEAGYATQLIHDTPHLVNGGHNFDWPFHAWCFERGAEVDRPWIHGSFEWPANWRSDPELDDLFGSLHSPQPVEENLCLIQYAAANRHRESFEDWNCYRLFARGAEFLRDNSGRDDFFLWIDCFDPHEPWDSPEEFLRRFDDTTGGDGSIDPRFFSHHGTQDYPAALARRKKAQYSSKVAWMDYCLGQFLHEFLDSTLAKNTLLILTSDHGTNLGERSRFGKTYPVHETEAHVPLLIRTPDGDCGQSKMLVQPQDICSTIAAASDAGNALPEELQGYDILAAVREDGSANASIVEKDANEGRGIALCGHDAGKWQPGTVLCTAFDGRNVFQFTPDPSACRLMGMYGEEPAQGSFEQLYRCVVDELRRRNTAPELMKWIEAGGRVEPAETISRHEFWPDTPAFRPYWTRSYPGRGISSS